MSRNDAHCQVSVHGLRASHVFLLALLACQDGLGCFVYSDVSVLHQVLPESEEGCFHSASLCDGGHVLNYGV